MVAAGVGVHLGLGLYQDVGEVVAGGGEPAAEDRREDRLESVSGSVGLRTPQAPPSRPLRSGGTSTASSRSTASGTISSTASFVDASTTGDATPA